MVCRLRVRRGLCADEIRTKLLKNSPYQSGGHTKAATLMSSYNHYFSLAHIQGSRTTAFVS